MADVLQLVLLICLGLVSCVGTTLNGMTMYVLLFNKTLCKKLASVRWLMLGQALADTLACGVGIPLVFWNVLVGEAAPFSNVPVICHAVEYVFYGTSFASIWYQTAIAITRLTAVLMPTFYKNYVRSTAGSAVLIISPWFLAYVLYAVGAIARAYYIRPTPGTGTCGANEYDDTSAAAERFGRYVLTDTIVHAWTPMFIGLLCYVVIYTTWWVKNLTKILRKKHPTIQPYSTAAVTTRKTDTNKTQPEMNDVAASIQTAWPTAAGAGPHPPRWNHTKQQHQERYNKIRLLAVAYVINICLIFPDTGFVWGFNYYNYLAENMPVLARVIDVGYYIAFPVNPLLYILASKDFRIAFKQLLLCRSGSGEG